MKAFLVTICFLLSFSLFANQSFMPENDMFIGAQNKSTVMTQIIFNQCIDDIEGLYKPIIENRFDAKLKVIRKWDDGTVNAYALQRGKKWEVHMFGGLARHKAITPDGFRAVICHELGHHAGGAPKIKNWTSKWASNEGQSDYFAMNKCLRRFFEIDLEETLRLYQLNIDPIVSAKCALSHESEEGMAICVREIKAGVSLATLLAGTKTISIETPDTAIVSRTYDKHPAAQCRLDTYIAASLCQSSLEDIPSSSDASQGYCMRAHGDDLGARPLCWYKPKK